MLFRFNLKNVVTQDLTNPAQAWINVIFVGSWEGS